MLVLCAKCKRHVHASGPCPFCSHSQRGSAATSLLVGLAAVGAAVLFAACYGAPPSDDDPWDEEDADARSEHVLANPEAGADEADGEAEADSSVE